MKEYIEREAVLKVLRGDAVAKYPSTFYMGLFAAAEEASKIPAADVRYVIHSKWEITDIDHAHGHRCYHCPECGEDEWRYEPTNFCPNCGADMREGDHACT